jgi:hypothetical protein
MKDLAALQGVQTLNIIFVKISDAGLKELAKMKNLRKLYIRREEGMTDAGIAALRKALPQCSIDSL